MNKKVKRDVIYTSIISGLLIVVMLLSYLVYSEVKSQEAKDVITSNMVKLNIKVSDSLRVIDEERQKRYHLVETNSDKLFWTRAEADTIYFRKIKKLLTWRENEIVKYE